MKTNKMVFPITVCLALALFSLNSCNTDTVSEPSPLGPASIGVVLELTANPNVILAPEKEKDRQSAVITATLAKYDGIPIPDRTVYFEIVNGAGKRTNLGYFDDELSMQTVVTDTDGKARTYYYGPLKDEVKADTALYIKATIAWEGSQNIQDTTLLYIVKDTN